MKRCICALAAASLILTFEGAALAQTKPASPAAPAPTASPAATAPSATPDKAKSGSDEHAKPLETGAVPTAKPEQSGSSRPNTSSVATGWSVGCASARADGKLRCEVTNNVVITPANQRFVSVAVRRDLTTSDELLVLTLPHGVVFTSGMIAQVDSKEVGKFEALTSDQQGAYAKMKLAPEVSAAMEKGTTLTVIFEGANGQKFTVGMGLAGFAPAHAKMKAEN